MNNNANITQTPTTLRPALCIAAAALAAGCIFTAQALSPAATCSVDQAYAASKAAKNKKAHSAYKKKTKVLARQSRSGLGAYYKYADINGDGLHELLIENHPSAGSGSVFYIYTYKSGKVKRLLKTEEYGFDQLRVYRKGKGLVAHSGGHGGESYTYFKKSGGTYKRLAGKSRSSAKYGGASTGSWYYYRPSGSSISKSTFSSKTASVTKGSSKKVKLSYNHHVTG